MNIWIEAARPKTLIASIAPVIIGTSIAFSDGSFNTGIFVATLLAAMSIQIGTNYANDYFDFIKGQDTSERKGPRRACASGLISPSHMKRGMILVFALAILSTALLIHVGGWPISVLLALAVLFGLAYTGGPFPLANLGLGDLFVLLFFGLIATATTHYLQAGYWSTTAIVAGVAPGLLGCAILAVNNLRDVNEDAKTGKRTLPVRFGETFGKIEYAVCIYLSTLTPLYLIHRTGKHQPIIFSSAALLFALPLIKDVFASRQFNPVLAKTGLFYALFTILFAIGWIL
ncbi:MAG: 1,4-dihydroxy-2-naphthoate octaprenyltransferase [Chlamydiia bacterium]|nr:1,4-dihydroxy-2-naphthoate octaprenyltransferase [Chlamydiia bacterium]MCH9615421.1 1,4-dihydroxy-2-naphthoate octaprenyltransferase [Chlamydiia bacterium]MCH9628257.1 1,4-dihydroxy-2-naphthoate octaprenyltransferase [Chlamydiia bacterium]